MIPNLPDCVTSKCISMKYPHEISQGSGLVFQTIVIQLIFVTLNMFCKETFSMENMFKVTKISWKTIVWKTRHDPQLEMVKLDNFQYFNAVKSKVVQDKDVCQLTRRLKHSQNSWIFLSLEIEGNPRTASFPMSGQLAYFSCTWKCQNSDNVSRFPRWKSIQDIIFVGFTLHFLTGKPRNGGNKNHGIVHCHSVFIWACPLSQ